jgi:hypothetical protein
MRLFLGLVAVCAIGCTKPNPAKTCVEGVCTEDRFPFCDVTGEYGGKPNECIAVTCTANEFAGCRENEAIACNATGDDYDVTQCAMGCSAGAAGCKQCTDNAQCANPSPVCDADTSSCRVCRVDDECASRLCDVGVCVPESSILYAAPVGGAQCSLTNPCSLDYAVTLARTSPTTNPWVRMLPGTFTVPIEMRFPTQHTVRVVATGATLTTAIAGPAIVADDGGKIAVRGLAISSPQAVKCGSAATSGIAEVTLSDGSINVTANQNSGAIDSIRCKITLTGVDVSLNANDFFATIDIDTTLRLDRTRIHGNISHYIIPLNYRITVEVTNSLLEDIGIQSNINNPGLPATQITVANST